MFNNFVEHWKFDIKEDITFPNAMYVHPLQQWDVQILFDSLYADLNVKLMVIFGSSVEFRCDSFSDIDLYLECDPIDHHPTIYYEYLTKEVDILLNFDHWNDQISREISEKGIVLFDRR